MKDDDVLEECLQECGCTDEEGGTPVLMVVFDEDDTECGQLYVSAAFEELTCGQKIAALHSVIGQIKALLREVCYEADIEYGGLLIGLASGETGVA